MHELAAHFVIIQTRRNFVFQAWRVPAVKDLPGAACLQHSASRIARTFLDQASLRKEDFGGSRSAFVGNGVIVPCKVSS